MALPRDRWRDAPAPIAAVLAACFVSAVAIAGPPPKSVVAAPASPSASASASAPPKAAPAVPPSAIVPYELTRPPRPPLPPREEKETVLRAGGALHDVVQPLRRHLSGLDVADEIEIGGDVVWAARTRPSNDTSGVSYLPALGFGLHARWDMLSFLRFSAYFVDARHDMQFAPNALGICPIIKTLPCPGNNIVIPPVHTFAFGARFQPIIHLTSRLNAWVSAGIGWGRMEFGQMQVFEVGQTIGPYSVAPRSDPFVELPLGFGVGFDIIPGWIAIEYEFNGAFISDQGGEAVNQAQGDNREGHLTAVAGFPPFAASFTQVLGLSLRL